MKRILILALLFCGVLPAQNYLDTTFTPIKTQQNPATAVRSVSGYTAAQNSYIVGGDVKSLPVSKTDSAYKRLVSTDSLLAYNNKYENPFVRFTFIDSANGITDSNIVTAYNAITNTYNQIALKNMKTGLYETVFIPGDGQLGMWIVPYPYPGILRAQRYPSASAYTPRWVQIRGNR